MKIFTVNDGAKVMADAGCGQKAINLCRLAEEGFNVPPFICVGEAAAAGDERQECCDGCKCCDEVVFLAKELEASGVEPPFAVRSSSAFEDGCKKSYAGQFMTFLDVETDELWDKIQRCLSHRARLDYEGKDTPGEARNEARKTAFAVVQSMVRADISGVMFTENPLGILSETVITVGAGLGSGVVEDSTATTTYFHNHCDGKGYATSQEGAPKLPEGRLDELLALKPRLETTFGRGLDVEFALCGEKLYLLQVRPITTIDRETSPLILDNSNIVESYPEITLPLTADFVTHQYATIFKGVISRLSGSKSIAKKYDEQLNSMVAAYNGRMYYNINHWYAVIGFLPFSKRILPIWRQMLGVKDDQFTPSEFKISWLQKLSIAVHTAYYFLAAPAKMKTLNRVVDEVTARFEGCKIADLDIAQLRQLYEETVETVMARWDYTLINDMYTFLHTGIFRALMRRRGATEEQLNRDMGRVAYLASMKPLEKMVAMACHLRDRGEDEIFSADFDEYVERYGDRSVGELKLETDTYRERPELLMAQIERLSRLEDLDDIALQVCGGGCDGVSMTERGQQERSERRERQNKSEQREGQERQLRHGGETASREANTKAETSGSGGDEREASTVSPGPSARFFLRRAKLGAENRERSRLERTKLFGYARMLFLQCGRILVHEGVIDDERAVFYMTMEEIFERGVKSGACANGGSDKASLTDTVASISERKTAAKAYEGYPAYTRVIFAGEVKDKPPALCGVAGLGIGKGELVGVPCSFGKAHGEVIIVNKQSDIKDVKGKILVTVSTDPGWIFLMVGAAGLISEKGSLLSHTAIVSRELGIPAIVGADGITQRVKNGDVVEMDCATGRIRLSGESAGK